MKPRDMRTMSDADILKAIDEVKNSERKPVVVLPVLECNRCGYHWVPKSTTPPKVCANKKCKSPYWNRERRS